MTGVRHRAGMCGAAGRRGARSLVAAAVAVVALTQAAVAVPPANFPPGCPPETMVFSSDSVMAIPDGPSIITSQIMVEGLTGSIWDVDVQTFIEHAEPRDLDITLTSPAGVVITLSTDNGSPTSPDCFNGTIWDDQADPGGALPYNSNQFIASDRDYVATGVAATLVPEEPLGGLFLASAFLPVEFSNGPWTLTINDDTAANGGTLHGWSLTLTALPTEGIESPLDPGGGIPPPVELTNSNPVAIGPGAETVFSTIAYPNLPGPICLVRLTTDIAHTSSRDLDITLTSPAGTVVTLTTDNGSFFDDVFTATDWSDIANVELFGGGGGDQVPYTFNDGMATDHQYIDLTPAGDLAPEEAFAAFSGEASGGVWILTIRDDVANAEGGMLNEWTLGIFTCQQVDTDMDGVADGCDQLMGDDAAGDDDGDGVANDIDVCAGDDAAGDADGDGVCDDIDACEGEDDSVDGDGDGVPDGCDALVGDDNAGDTDGDGVADDVDNCVEVSNADQADADGDGLGDACPSPPAGQACCGGGMPMVLPLLLLAGRRGIRRRARGRLNYQS